MLKSWSEENERLPNIGKEISHCKAGAMSRKPAEPARKEQNEYIPAFISKKPFYLESADSENDYLEHQRLQGSIPDQSRWYDRGKRAGPAATKFRKGACENCGAMTHKTKECLSRPRAKGAKWTGRNIQADELVQDVQLGWDAKRDRWNGYDAGEYRNVTDEYEELENLKRKVKGEGQADGQLAINGPGEDQSRPDGENQEQEEARYAEESDMGRQQSTATRNLRIREDTAKYLLNLDLDSAKYDPKTRSMVDVGAQADQASAMVAEENFMRASGDAAEFERAQRYAWESQERGDKNKTHLQANPTSGEYFRRKEQEEREKVRESRRNALLAKYGGEQHLQPSQFRDTAVVESEKYFEYDASGGVKGRPQQKATSKYQEDVFINNHTSVWGSWWFDFQWGYACCHSHIKNSYCTGAEGKQALEEASRTLLSADASEEGRKSIEEPPLPPESEHNEAGHSTTAVNDSKVNGASKKRTLTEMKNGITDEELEAYKKARAVASDPMAKMLGRDELMQ